MKPVLVILGTRPECIKLAPVVRELQKRGHPYTVLATGQHTALFNDTGLSDEFPITGLDVANTGDPEAFVWQVRERLARVYYEHPEHIVLVQGDTASAYAGGLWAHKANWPLVHLEAGLRTGDLEDPCPEEFYRTELDRWAHLCLAPTVLAVRELETLGFGCKTKLVGNTVVDALKSLGIHPTNPKLRTHTVLVTLHRRESFGEPMEQIVQGLLDVAKEQDTRYGTLFRWPAHPNPHVQKLAQSLKAKLTKPFSLGNVSVENPMPYPTFVRTLAICKAVLTDSGGVAEEAATLGIPCVIARTKTERMEAVHNKQALLVGKTREGVADGLRKALNGELSSIPSTIFGDGTAAFRTVNHLEGM